MDGGVGQTAWAPEGREGRSQAGPKGEGPPARRLLVIEYLDIFNGYPFGYFQGDFLQSLHGQMFPISQEDQYIYRNTDTKMSQIEEEKKHGI